jgi:hypothetical protein
MLNFMRIFGGPSLHPMVSIWLGLFEPTSTFSIGWTFRNRALRIRFGREIVALHG